MSLKTDVFSVAQVLHGKEPLLLNCRKRRT